MNKKKRQTFTLTISIVIMVILLLCMIVLLFQSFLSSLKKPQNIFETSVVNDFSDTDLSETEASETDSLIEDTYTFTPAYKIDENTIYSFFQGPSAWESGIPWSGAWCREELDGGRFSVFGCGLCTLANIYSTLTPYECSPLDMYYYARKVTDYSPGGGFGAIDWPYLKEALKKTGFTCKIKNKPKTYNEFKKDVLESMTSIMLVSSYNDNSYWETTEGHYVNLWSYDRIDDTILLADSGSISHNRARIPLRYVYDALKTAGEHQYLLVTDYKEKKNTWKYSGIHEEWNKPDYYTPKPERDG